MAQERILSYRDLEVWNVGMDLVLEVYALIRELPSSERYALSAQLRRSAVSIPSNVAEGYARRGKAYRDHVRIALGSLAELETQIEVAVRLGLLSTSRVAAAVELAKRVGQMLHGLLRSLLRQHIVDVGTSALLLVPIVAVPILLLL